ncbi:MAG: adenosine nucleotide hydrolase [Kordia sp.]|nr:MAG: adenosine nucleotide hydrolase [Kordia sp.]
MKALSSWSGGKDSCFALMKVKEEGYVPTVLLNMMNENGKVSRSHGLKLQILEAQAKAMNLPLVACASTWGNYELNYINTLKSIKDKHQIEAVVFGDIDIESHRQWEEKVCKSAETIALLPLWQGDRKELVLSMIKVGIKAIIVSCDLTLGVAFLGREIDESLLDELEGLGVDCCGENGEYHTLVVDCPLFDKPIELLESEKIEYDNYCFLTWK